MGSSHRDGHALTVEPAPTGHTGPHFLWPRFDPAAPGGAEHGLLRFYRGCGVRELAEQLLRPELPPDDPDFAQLAATVPPWPHRPGGPHVDGISPQLPDGQPGTFSLLAGVWLTGPAGGVLLAHYLLGHNVGGHDAPAGAVSRQVVYYRRARCADPVRVGAP